MLSRRLRQSLSERNLTWQKCSELANIPIETMRNLYYGKVKDPKVSTLLNIAQVLHTSVNWLMGENVYSEDEIMLLNHYRQCGVHGKNVVLQVSRYQSLIALEERESSNKHLITCFVPDTLVCDGSKFSIIETKKIITSEENAFMALYVPNNNWAPRYCKHDIILFKKNFPTHDEEALFIYQNKAYYRRYLETDTNHILRCINRRYPDLSFNRMDAPTLLFIGTATGIIRA